MILLFLLQTFAGFFLIEGLKLAWEEILPKKSKPFSNRKLKNLFQKKIKGETKLSNREEQFLTKLSEMIASDKKEYKKNFKKEFKKWRATIKEDQDKVLEELDTAIARLGIFPDEIKTVVEKALLRSAFYLFVDTQKFLKGKDDELQATRVYVSRADELEKLDEFLDSDNRLLLISGDRGVGKTRLLVEYARLLEEKGILCYFTSPVTETDAKKYEYELNQLAKGKELILLVDEIDKFPKQFLDLFGSYSRVEGKDEIRVIGCTYYPDDVHVSPFEPAIQPYHLNVFEDESKLKEVAIGNFPEIAGSKDLDELVRHLNGYPDAVIAFFFMLQKGEIKWGELASRDKILEKRFKEQYEKVEEHVQALATLAAIQMVGGFELENFDRFYQKYHNVSFEAALRNEYVLPHVGYVEDPGVWFFRSRELLGLYMVKRFFFDEGGAGDLKALAEVEGRNLSASSFIDRLLSLREVFERDNNERCLAKCDLAISVLLEEIQKPGSHAKALFRVIDTLDDRYARRGILCDKKKGGKVVWERLKERLRGLPEQKDRAMWLHNMGMVLGHLGEPREAKSWYEQSLEIKKELGDKSGIASTLHQLGNIAYHQGNYKEARELYEQSLEIEKELGDKSGIAYTLGQIGNLVYGRGDYTEAGRIYEEVLDTSKELGDRSSIAKALHQLGMIAHGQGDYAEARRLYEQSLEIKKELGDKSGIALTLHQLGNIAYHQGNYKEARELYEQSLEIEKELGNKSGIAGTLGQVGRLAEAQDNNREAIVSYIRVLNMFAQLKAPEGKIVFGWIERLCERVGQEEFEKLVKQAGEELGQDLSFVLKWFEGK